MLGAATLKRRQPMGRYQSINSAPMPGGAAFEKEGVRTPHVEVRYARERDPSPDPVLRMRDQRVQVNVRTDIIEYEYKSDRLSWAAAGAARCYLRVLEQQAGRTNNGQTYEPTDGCNRSSAKDYLVVCKIETAREINDHVQFVASGLGKEDHHLLREILLGNHSYTSYACHLGYAGDWGRKTVGRRFRQACETLVKIYSSQDARRVLFRLTA